MLWLVDRLLHYLGRTAPMYVAVLFTALSDLNCTVTKSAELASVNRFSLVHDFVYQSLSPPCTFPDKVSFDGGWVGLLSNAKRFSNYELPITDTELKAIAAAATMGLSRPRAAMGIPAAL